MFVGGCGRLGLVVVGSLVMLLAYCGCVLRHMGCRLFVVCCWSLVGLWLVIVGCCWCVMCLFILVCVCVVLNSLRELAMDACDVVAGKTGVNATGAQLRQPA